MRILFVRFPQVDQGRAEEHPHCNNQQCSADENHDIGHCFANECEMPKGRSTHLQCDTCDEKLVGILTIGAIAIVSLFKIAEPASIVIPAITGIAGFVTGTALGVKK